MDDLDKQLAELQMMADKEKLSHHSGTLGKKIGPAVPPKPKKSTQPQVPQSYSIKQQLEPSYSSSLHTSNTPQYYSNLPITSNTARVPSPNSTPVIQQCQYANIDPPASLHHHSLRSTNSNSGAVNHYSNLPNTGTNNSLRQQQVSVAMSPAAKAQRAVISNSMSSSGAATYGNTGVAPQQAVYSNMAEDRDGVIYSNLARVGSGARGGIYSNVPGSGKAGGYCENDDLPLPPPPVLPLDHKHNILPPPGDYAPCTVNTNFPPPPQDEFPPPPSPVSSSYSELRRATEPNHTDYNYGSQSSSTYESIYEPINPRPPSQLSSRSNYSLYTPYTGTSGQSINTASGQVPVGNSSTNAGSKDQEVDALTDLLVQRMDGDNRDRGQNAGDESNSGEVDVYGVCVKCGEKVIGENSGCTAMEQVYHTSCFTCEHCAINLQGKPFYALEGNPYCKEDYLNTLEKCCVCMNPILDRILRATGKPYHPKCFCCIICGKSLDGIPFTVDATNQIHCIDDFHKKFAPKCCVCNQPIMPEPGQEETVRVVALDRSFHIQCYKCEDCGLVLSSEAEGRGCYPLDNHVLCKSCNAKRVQTLTSHMTTEL